MRRIIEDMGFWIHEEKNAAQGGLRFLLFCALYFQAKSHPTKMVLKFSSRKWCLQFPLPDHGISWCFAVTSFVFCLLAIEGIFSIQFWNRSAFSPGFGQIPDSIFKKSSAVQFRLFKNMWFLFQCFKRISASFCCQFSIKFNPTVSPKISEAIRIVVIFFCAKVQAHFHHFLPALNSVRVRFLQKSQVQAHFPSFPTHQPKIQWKCCFSKKNQVQAHFSSFPTYPSATENSAKVQFLRKESRPTTFSSFSVHQPKIHQRCSFSKKKVFQKGVSVSKCSSATSFYVLPAYKQIPGPVPPRNISGSVLSSIFLWSSFNWKPFNCLHKKSWIPVAYHSSTNCYQSVHLS